MIEVPYSFSHHGDFRQSTLVDTERKLIILPAGNPKCSHCSAHYHYVKVHLHGFERERWWTIVTASLSKFSWKAPFDWRYFCVTEGFCSFVSIVNNHHDHQPGSTFARWDRQWCFQGIVALCCSSLDGKRLTHTVFSVLWDYDGWSARLSIYQDDLLHPSTMAVEYIQQHVSGAQMPSYESEKICEATKETVASSSSERTRMESISPLPNMRWKCASSNITLDWSDEKKRLQEMLV